MFETREQVLLALERANGEELEAAIQASWENMGAENTRAEHEPRYQIMRCIA